MIKQAAVLMSSMIMAIAGEYYYMQDGREIGLVPLEKNMTSVRTNRAPLRFKTESGEEIAIPNRLVVKFERADVIDAVVEKYRLRVVKRYRNDLLLLEAASPKNALDAANALCREPYVIYAQPDLIKKWKLR